MGGKWFLPSASLVLLTLAAIGVTVLPRATPKKTKPEEPVSPASPVGDINLSGKIRAQHVIGVSPMIEGTVGALFVEVGQEVFEGQLLARLNNEGLDSGQQAAKRELEQTQSRVNSLESEVIAARLEASRARADASRARGEFDRLERAHRRQQMLFNEGATPKLAYEKSSREFQQAQSEFGTLEKLAANAEAHVAEVIRNLDAEKRTLREKTEGLETETVKAGSAELLSPTQGMVVARKGEVGRTVGPDNADFFQIATQLSLLDVHRERGRPGMRYIHLGHAAGIGVSELGAIGVLRADK